MFCKDIDCLSIIVKKQITNQQIVFNSLKKDNSHTLASLIHMSQSYIRDFHQTKTSQTKRKQLELQLLKAFDNEISQDQIILGRNKQTLLPQGIPYKSYTQKGKLRESSWKSYSVEIKKSRPKPINQTTSRKLPLLKALQELKTSKNKNENLILDKQPTHRSSNNSKTSSVKSFHLNKRKRLMTEFYQQKQTQKLVQRLLNIKPSQQVTKQVQLQSYNKHLMLKNIMMHRVSDQPAKKDVLPSKSKLSKENSIDLKQKDLERFLKEEKKKTRKVSLIGILSLNRQPDTLTYKKGQIKREEYDSIQKKKVYSKSSCIIPLSVSKLPRLKVMVGGQERSIEKKWRLKIREKTQKREIDGKQY